MKVKRPSPAMVVALIALVMSTTGAAVAAVNYAQNAGAVDGYSAVKASSSNNKAKGKLVAMNSSGKLPFKFLDGAASQGDLDRLSGLVARGRNGVTLAPVPDNGETAQQTLLDLELGNLNFVCHDTQDKVGTENAATRVVVTNHSGGLINIARRAGVAAPVIATIDNNTADSFDIGAANTFSVHLQANEKTVVVEGVAREAGPGTADAGCGIWATAFFVE